MRILLAAVFVSGVSFLAAPAARAQTGPAFALPSPSNREASARHNPGNNAGDLARNQRRATMTPEEAQRDQQMELLETRTGNTSFGGHNGAPERQFDSNRSGNGNGFMVRKFKTQPGKPGYVSKRGSSHPVGGSNPSGKPLVHRHGRKKFLFF